MSDAAEAMGGGPALPWEKAGDLVAMPHKKNSIMVHITALARGVRAWQQQRGHLVAQAQYRGGTTMKRTKNGRYLGSLLG